MKCLQVALSEAQRVSLKVPVGGPDGRGVAVVLTRQHFEKLATPLFERMRLAVDEACWQVSIGLADTIPGAWTASGSKQAEVAREGTV